MKFVSLILVFACVLGAALVQAQQIKDPKIFASGGGSPKTGYNVNVDAQKNIWQSNNGRHSVDATGGYSQHLGGPYGNSRPDYRVGGVYKYRF